MKTNPFFFCLVSLLLLSSTLFSRDVSINSARLVAKNIYFERFGLNNEITFEEIEFNSENIITSNSTAVFYIFNVKNDGGFVIVSADDNLYPVLGYSFEGKYSDNDQPPAFSWWLDNYKQQILYTKENSIPANDKIRSAWSYYLSTSSKQGAKQIMNVSPLLSTTWDQGCYYNALCPVNSSGPCGHVWAGCVATTMGQVMKYHSYPQQGTGSYSYFMPGYGTQSANFGNTTYDWQGMPNHLNGHDSTVAEFLYHCGVSVDMYYSTSGSGAMSYKVVNSLISFFKYSGSAVQINKSDYTNSNWENVLKNELDASRPIYYDGYDTSQSGHAFVCDGYQGSGDNHFHFNWGWNGNYNGYFYVSSLSPGSSNYSTNQNAIIGIKPITGNCSGYSTLVSNYGIIDDGSGNADYQNNADCQWLIQPGGAVAIALDFTSFSTEAGVDFVNVYDGADTTAPLLGSFSGNNLPNQLMSTSGSMLVHFTSNNSNTNLGWSAIFYNTVPPLCSGTDTLSVPSGTFDDGSDSSDYGNMSDCQWLIKPEAGLSVTLTFNYFHTEFGHDIVKIYNGSTTSSPILLIFSGDNTPPPITSGSTMLVTFTTDIYITEGGWSASYTSTNSLGMEENNLSNSLSLYPNPCNGVFTVSINNNIEGEVKLTINDILGRKLETFEFNKSSAFFSEEVNLLNLSEGLYFLSIELNESRISKRFVIK